MRYLVFLFFIIGYMLLCVSAYGAEESLPIKVKIVRCVTFEEKKEACLTENLCCELLENQEREDE